MNREILFRGKRKDNNEWVEGSLLILESGYYIVLKGTYYNEIDIIKDCTANAIWEEQDFFEVIPETVSQYTGLDDKKGKKIFENDVVIYESKKCVIKYWQQGFKYKIIGGDYLYYLGECLNHCEIIGSIFDNPELLDKEVK